jgi:hypothetical protein
MKDGVENAIGQHVEKQELLGVLLRGRCRKDRI